MSNEERDRAWAYYQHADNLVHNRHNIFIVAQSIFFAALTGTQSSNTQLRPAIVFAGFAYAICWWWVSVRLAARMHSLDAFLREDSVYRQYIEAFKVKDSDDHHSRRRKSRYRTWTANLLMNKILPLGTAAVWAILATADLAPKLWRLVAALL